MANSQKFFRYVWRVDAVLILAATAMITFGVGSLLLEEFAGRSARVRDAREGIPLGAPESNVRLSLGRAVLVPGTNVMRADLIVSREGKDFSSSGGYNETRNILFIDPNQKEAHWLLHDNDHVINQNFDVTDDRNPSARRTLATVVLVKPASDRPDTVNGRLLLFAPSGRTTIQVSDDVREFHVASVVGDELTILYERERRFVLASFDPGALTKKTEREINVPQLK